MASRSRKNPEQMPRVPPVPVSGMPYPPAAGVPPYPYQGMSMGYPQQHASYAYPWANPWLTQQHMVPNAQNFMGGQIGSTGPPIPPKKGQKENEEYLVDSLRRIYNNDDESIEIERVKVQRRTGGNVDSNRQMLQSLPQITGYQAHQIPPHPPEQSSSSSSSALVPADHFLNERRPPPRKKKKNREMNQMNSYSDASVVSGGQNPWAYQGGYFPYMPYPAYPYAYGYMWPNVQPQMQDNFGGWQSPTSCSEASLQETGSEDSRTSVEIREIHSPDMVRPPSSHGTADTGESSGIAPSDSVSMQGIKDKRSLEKLILKSLPRKDQRQDEEEVLDSIESSDVDKTREWMQEMQKTFSNRPDSRSEISRSELTEISSFTTAASEAPIDTPSPPTRRIKKRHLVVDTSKLKNRKSNSESNIFGADLTSNLTNLSSPPFDSRVSDTDLMYAFRKLEKTADTFQSHASIGTSVSTGISMGTADDTDDLETSTGEGCRKEDEGRTPSRSSTLSFHSTKQSTEHLFHTDSTQIPLPAADESFEIELSAENFYSWVLQDSESSDQFNVVTEDREVDGWRTEVSLWRARLVVSLCRGAGLDQQDWDTFQLLVQHPLKLEHKLSLLHANRICSNNCNLGVSMLRNGLLHLTTFGETLLKPEEDRPHGWKTILVDSTQPWAPVKGSLELLRASGFYPRDDGTLRYRRKYAPETSVIARLTLDMLVLSEEFRLYLTGAHKYPNNVATLFMTVCSTPPNMHHPPICLTPPTMMETMQNPQSGMNHYPGRSSCTSPSQTAEIQAGIWLPTHDNTAVASQSSQNMNTVQGDQLNMYKNQLQDHYSKGETHEKKRKAPIPPPKKSKVSSPSLHDANINTSLNQSVDGFTSRSMSTNSSLPDLQSLSPTNFSQNIEQQKIDPTESSGSVTPIASPVPMESASIEESGTLSAPSPLKHTEEVPYTRSSKRVDESPYAKPKLEADPNDRAEDHIYEEIGEIRAQVKALKAASEPPPPLPPKTRSTQDDPNNTYPHMDWSVSSTCSSLRGGSTGARRKKRRAPMPPEFMPPNWKENEATTPTTPTSPTTPTNPFEVKDNQNPFFEKAMPSGYVGKNPFYETIAVKPRKPVIKNESKYSKSKFGQIETSKVEDPYEEISFSKSTGQGTLKSDSKVSVQETITCDSKISVQETIACDSKISEQVTITSDSSSSGQETLNSDSKSSCQETSTSDSKISEQETITSDSKSSGRETFNSNKISVQETITCDSKSSGQETRNNDDNIFVQDPITSDSSSSRQETITTHTSSSSKSSGEEISTSDSKSSGRITIVSSNQNETVSSFQTIALQETESYSSDIIEIEALERNKHVIKFQPDDSVKETDNLKEKLHITSTLRDSEYNSNVSKDKLHDVSGIENSELNTEIKLCKSRENKEDSDSNVLQNSGTNEPSELIEKAVVIKNNEERKSSDVEKPKEKMDISDQMYSKLPEHVHVQLTRLEQEEEKLIKLVSTEHVQVESEPLKEIMDEEFETIESSVTKDNNTHNFSEFRAIHIESPKALKPEPPVFLTSIPSVTKNVDGKLHLDSQGVVSSSLVENESVHHAQPNDGENISASEAKIDSSLSEEIVKSIESDKLIEKSQLSEGIGDAPTRECSFVNIYHKYVPESGTDLRSREGENTTHTSSTTITLQKPGQEDISTQNKSDQSSTTAGLNDKNITLQKTEPKNIYIENKSAQPSTNLPVKKFDEIPYIDSYDVKRFKTEKKENEQFPNIPTIVVKYPTLPKSDITAADILKAGSASIAFIDDFDIPPECPPPPPPTSPPGTPQNSPCSSSSPSTSPLPEDLDGTSENVIRTLEKVGDTYDKMGGTTEKKGTTTENVSDISVEKAATSEKQDGTFEVAEGLSENMGCTSEKVGGTTEKVLAPEEGLPNEIGGTEEIDPIKENVFITNQSERHTTPDIYSARSEGGYEIPGKPRSKVVETVDERYEIPDALAAERNRVMRDEDNSIQDSTGASRSSRSQRMQNSVTDPSPERPPRRKKLVSPSPPPRPPKLGALIPPALPPKYVTSLPPTPPHHHPNIPLHTSNTQAFIPNSVSHFSNTSIPTSNSSTYLRDPSISSQTSVIDSCNPITDPSNTPSLVSLRSTSTAASSNQIIDCNGPNIDPCGIPSLVSLRSTSTTTSCISANKPCQEEGLSHVSSADTSSVSTSCALISDIPTPCGSPLTIPTCRVSSLAFIPSPGFAASTPQLSTPRIVSSTLKSPQTSILKPPYLRSSSTTPSLKVSQEALTPRTKLSKNYETRKSWPFLFCECMHPTKSIEDGLNKKKF